MTCAKARVTCRIITLDGQEFHGNNDCNNPQQVCPRIAAGSVRDDYALCKQVCEQVGHAEAAALAAAGRAQVPVVGATAYVTHHRVCGRCEAALKARGVARIVCDPVLEEGEAA